MFKNGCFLADTFWCISLFNILYADAIRKSRANLNDALRKLSKLSWTLWWGNNFLSFCTLITRIQCYIFNHELRRSLEVWLPPRRLVGHTFLQWRRRKVTLPALLSDHLLVCSTFGQISFCPAWIRTNNLGHWGEINYCLLIRTRNGKGGGWGGG